MSDQPTPKPKAKPRADPKLEQIAAENEELRARLNDAEETLRAIRDGEVDAFVMSDTEGAQIRLLSGNLEPYREMVEAMNDGAVTLATDGTILYANPRFIDWVKVPSGQIVGRQLQHLLTEETRERFDEVLAQREKRSDCCQLTLQATDGSQRPTHFSMSPLPQSDGRAIFVVITDLSDEIAAADARSRLALIVESSDDAIISTSLNGVVESWNKAAKKLYGYTAKEAIGQALDSLIVPPDLIHEIKSEFAAIRQGKKALFSESVRLRKDGTQVEVAIKASPIINGADEIIGVSINARDLTEKQLALKLLRESLEDTIVVVASTLEKRDPYTAGHQKRVSELAKAIAQKLSLPEEQIHAIYLAGIIHDLGKINIPTEILSKPGRLSDLEYKLIQTHSESGYDILKDVKFPWPIADIVRQHHERLNGSGYPQGLKSNQILLESKIIAVADVVEAMATHRPYREGLGIEAALAEINDKSGILFDAKIVDACTSLFHEDGYAIPK